MRQSIGGAWLFSISITLMMFIIAYVSITIDYSNAYQLKDDVTLYIEQYNGLTKDSAQLIMQRMKTRKFTTQLNCQRDFDSNTYYNGSQYDGDAANHYYTLIDYNRPYSEYINAFQQDGPRGYICIYKYYIVKKDSYDDTVQQHKHFYAVSTAFGFNFPIIGNVFNYKVTGETGAITYPNTDNEFNFDS